MIELKDITKIYRMGETEVRALDGVSLTIEDGEFVAIMGPSGSGKSTLAHVIGLLDAPSDGSYRLNGSETLGLNEDDVARMRREQIGFIFQQFNLLPRLSAEENVRLPLFYSGRDTDPDAAFHLLELVGLGDRADHRPSQLSGGQQQRVAIARSLINRPRMILADEPTGNLDSKSETEILAVLRRLNAEGITIVMVTHEDEVGAKADRLIRMRDGRVVSDQRNSPRAAESREHAASPEANRQNGATIEARSVFTALALHFTHAFQTLAANKVRTFLSILGILIGVAAVVAMMALGRGARAAIEEQLASLGSNLLVLRPGAVRVAGVTQDAGGTTRLTLDDVHEIESEIPTVKRAAGTVSGRGQVTFRDKNWSTMVFGASASYVDIHSIHPQFGRFFTDEESEKRARVVVIGMTLVRELFGDKNPIGEEVKINKVNFLVIGVLPEKGNNGWRDQDDYLIVPVTTGMKRLMGKSYVDSIDIEMKTAGAGDETTEAIENLLFARKRVPASLRDGAYQIRNMADIQEALSESSRTMSKLLAAVAAISLLVGGIGIMNIMLVSVTERTREIGLRKAIGAKPRDILAQFLVESVAVSLVGGGLGLALGWAIAMALSKLAGWATLLSPDAGFLAFGFSAAIGVIFGLYPARRASRLHPIEALRHD